jgi:hypothetical protein
MAEPLDKRESDAILAGLRMLQAWRDGNVTTRKADMDVSIDDIETRGGEHDPMTSEELDELCEKVNCSELQA